MHGVNKPDGSICTTVDFSQTVNPVVISTLHTLPRPEDIFRKVQNDKFFSKIDLTKAYWHIKLAEESQYLTTFNTESHGLVMFCRLPMGLTDSGACFQQAVEEKLQGLDGVYPYLDDILISGKTQVEHDSRVRAVFQRLAQNNFRVKETKTILAMQTISMLGHILTVTDSGLQITPDPSRSQSVLNLPTP